MSRKGNKADLAPSRRERKGIGQYILGFFLLLYTLFCGLPIVLVFIAAFTDEVAINQNGFSFFPEKWSMSGFNAVLRYGKQLLTSYGVTIFVTVVGTFLGLMVMAMFAYAISRKGFKLGKFLSVYLLIPMLFNGGQLSGYIIFTSYYHLKDSLLLLILPLCVSTMNVIILRTFIVNSIPAELMEAAKIDGCNESQTTRYIVLPLMRASFTICMFLTITRCFMIYDVNLSLTEGGPYGSTVMAAMYVFQKAFSAKQYGVGQTEAIILFIFTAVIAVSQTIINKRKEVEA